MPIGLDEWLAMPRSQLAEEVKRFGVSVKVGLDGTTRHYLLRHPNPQGKILDFEDYARQGVAQALRIVDLVFSCGVQTLLLLTIWPPDLERREDYLRRAARGTQELLLSELPLTTYKRLSAKVRLYGDYDISPIFEPIRELFYHVRRTLEEETPEGEHLLLWGYLGGPAIDEMIARSINLYQVLGRQPTQAEVRLASFPWGPEKLDIFIGSGWLRAEAENLPPLLDKGTDIYKVSHLIFDLSENELRRILYDSLFLRRASSSVEDVH